MKLRILPIILILPQFVSADILTSSQRFFGIGGQYPSYSEEGEEVVASALDQGPYSPADSDLGVQNILLEQPSRFPVILNLRTGFYFTENAPAPFFRPNEPSSLFMMNADIAYRPHLWNGWFGDFGLGYDYLDFGDSAALDYENMVLRFGVYKNLPDLDDAIVFTRFDFQKITTGSFIGDDYHAPRFRVGLQKAIWTAPRHLLTGTLSYAHEWDTNSDILQRDEISLNLSYQYSITDAVFLAANTRVYKFNYDEFGREDWMYALSLELVWQFSQNFRATSGVFFDKNDSNRGTGQNDIQAFTTGLGLGLELQF